MNTRRLVPGEAKLFTTDQTEGKFFRFGDHQFRIRGIHDVRRRANLDVREVPQRASELMMGGDYGVEILSPTVEDGGSTTLWRPLGGTGLTLALGIASPDVPSSVILGRSPEHRGIDALTMEPVIIAEEVKLERDPRISRSHVEIQAAAEGVYITDLNSTNGVYLAPV